MNLREVGKGWIFNNLSEVLSFYVSISDHVSYITKYLNINYNRYIKKVDSEPQKNRYKYF